MRFAHMKRILRLDRLRLRGLSGVRDEVLLTATAQNLRRLAKLICRAPPPLAVDVLNILEQKGSRQTTVPKRTAQILAKLATRQK